MVYEIRFGRQRQYLMTKPLTVAVCADRRMEIGVHVTLHSLVSHASNDLNIYLFHNGYDSTRLSRIAETLSEFQRKYTLIPIALRDEMFSSLPALNGSRYVYARLVIPNYIAEPRFIYLDCDVVVSLDIGQLFAEPLDGHIIGVSGMGTVAWQVDKSFFEKRGIAGGTPYFNSGVLVIDADRWRQQCTTEHCLSIAAAYRGELLSHDQTILNFHFLGQAKILQPQYNYLLFPNGAFVGSAPGPAIYHFLGRPKPWEFLGEFTVTNYTLFEATLSLTSFAGYRSYTRFGPNEAKAVARLAKFYLQNAWRNRPKTR